MLKLLSLNGFLLKLFIELSEHVGFYFSDTFLVDRFFVTQAILQILFIHSQQKALSKELLLCFGEFNIRPEKLYINRCAYYLRLVATTSSSELFDELLIRSSA
jgi:hypothetical protein